MASFDTGSVTGPEDPMTTPVFAYSTRDFLFLIHEGAACCSSHSTKFDKESEKRWELAKKENVMKYELNLLYKLLPGPYNLACQLNIERGQLRRKPQPHRSLDDPFNHRRFNYTKIKPAEILLDLRCTDDPVTEDPLDRHLLCVNQSPIERTHCLVVPCIQRCLPQVLTTDCFRLATHLILLSGSPRFAIAFNSLLAHASVNHLHFHTFYWPYKTEITFKAVEKLSGSLFLLNEGWYIPAFVFQLKNPDRLNHFIKCVMTAAQYLHNRGVAHNLVLLRAPSLRGKDGTEWAHGNSLTNCGCETDSAAKSLYVTAYLFPRKSVFGSKPIMNLNPAACELGGMMLIYTFQFFRLMTEPSIIRTIEDEAKHSPEEFELIARDLVPFFPEEN